MVNLTSKNIASRDRFTSLWHDSIRSMKVLMVTWHRGVHRSPILSKCSGTFEVGLGALKAD